MLVRVSRGSTGLIYYLETGKRPDWDKTRQQKDDVVPVYGNRELFKKTENYLNDKKNYSDNYLHITISFSKEEQEMLYEKNEEERDQIIKEITEFYIKHHTSGYDLDAEVIAYAERHRPKIKLNEKGMERFEHVHLGIALYNPLSDTKLRTTFANNDFIDSVLQSYINKKYDFTVPRKEPRYEDKETKEKNTEILKKYYADELSDIRSDKELIDYFDSNNIKYKEVSTKKNHYYKIITSSKYNNINLNTKDFKHIEFMVDNKDYIFPEDRAIKELESILDTYYKERIDTISKRESKKTRAKKEEIYKDIYNDKVNSISMTYQQKIFYKHYGHKVGDKLKGYYVDTGDDKEVKFINKEKNIKVVDKGDKITTDRSTDNLEEKVKLMLDIAEAKEWGISTITITGSDAFKKEAKRQIAERLRATKQHKNLTSTVLAVANKKAIKNPVTPLEHQVRRDAEKKEEAKAEEKPNLKLLKQILRAEAVLEYAVQVYGINMNEHEVTEDNKINNKNNRQKPKNIIDFLQKEIHLTSAEAIFQCQELFKDQPLPVDTMPVPTPKPEKAKKPVVLKTKKKGLSGEQRTLYKSISRENDGRERQARSDMRTLSSIKLLSNKEKRGRVLLSADERNRVRSETDTDYGVRPSGDRGQKVANQDRGTRVRGLEMPLKLSICKNENFGVTTEWEEVEVKKYSELVTLMKMHPYSTAFFNEANEDQRQKFYEKYDSYPKGGYRSGKNVEAFGNLLIYDIDNDKYDKPLLIEEAKKLLESKKVSGIMMPSRSHNKPKKVASDHQRKHGKPVIEEYHTAERFRIVIPINKPFKSIDLEYYREFQELTAKALGVEQFTDSKALRDRGRFYYKSPIEYGYTEAKVGRVMVIDELSRIAIKRVDQRRAEAVAERERIVQIRADIQQYRQAPKATGNALTYANVEAIINQPITPLILKFEHGKAFKDGSYDIVKTSNAKYSIIDNNDNLHNVAFDFKSDSKYNPLTYLQEQLGTNNLNIIAIKLQEIDGNNYMIINYDAVKSVVGDAMQTATNDKTFEETVRQGFDVKYCKLEKDSIKIAGKEIKLSEIGLEKSDLIQAFRSNREVIRVKEEAEKKAQQEAEKIATQKAEAERKVEAEKKAKEVEVEHTNKEEEIEQAKEIKSTLGKKKEPKQGKGQAQSGGGRKM